MRALALLAGLALLIASPPIVQTASAQTVPQFQVDPFWPKPLPNNWLFGQIGGVAVDEQDHVWVLQRPRSLTEDEKGAALKPPRNACCVPAPRSWSSTPTATCCGLGRPGMPGVEWVGREHGIYRRPQGLRLAERQRRQRQRAAQVHPGRQVRPGDRQDRAERRQQRHHPARQAGRHRRSIPRPTRSMSPTAMATAGSSCSTPRPAPTSAIGAPTARSPTMPRRPSTILPRRSRSSSATPCIA